MATLTWLEPEQIFTGANPAMVWRTAGDRYRVARVEGPEPRFVALARFNCHGETILRNDMRNLEAAIDIVERHAAEDFNVHRIESNRATIEAHAAAAGLDCRPKADLRLRPEQIASRRASLERLLAKKGKSMEFSEPELASPEQDGKSLIDAAGVCRENEPSPGSNQDMATATKSKKKGTKATKAGKKAAPKPEDAGEKKLSAINAAYAVLAAKGEPMGCQDMIVEMEGQGLWKSPGGKTPAATLYSAILREISTKGADSRFVKADRGKFAAKQ